MTRRIRLPSGRARVAAIGVVAAIVAGLVLAIVAGRSRTSEPTDDRTAWQQMMAATPESGIPTLEMARQAFSLAFEPLPGVDLPEGRRGEIMSGTVALTMVLAHWTELTEQEQAIVLPFLQPQDESSSVEESADAPGFASAAMIATNGTRTASAALPDAATRAAIADSILGYRRLFDGSVGKKMFGEIEVFYNATTRNEGPGTAPAAYTLPHSSQQVPKAPVGDRFAELTGTIGSYSGCYVWINPYGWQLTGTDLGYVLAHEVFHCFQAFLAPSLKAFHASPPWVLEGSANWAASQVVPASTYPAGFWSEYLLAPALPLRTQSYEAIGFWNHVDESTALDPWRLVQGTLGRTSSEAFVSAGGAEPPFLDSWGSSFFRQPSFGLPWNTSGATMPDVQVDPEVVGVSNGGRAHRAAVRYANAVLYADVRADVVVVVAQGHVNMHNQAENVARFGQRVDCALPDGCACPPGSANTFPPPPALGGREIALGITGGLTGAAVALGGVSLAQWCAKSNPPLSKPPAAESAASGTPASNDAALCNEIVERLGVDGLLGHPTMTSADIESCVSQILASGGFPRVP